MLTERIDRRVLGALRLVDRPTGTPLARPMQISSESARLVRNLHGLYVVTRADGLESHGHTFRAAPDSPALGAHVYEIEVHDPQQRYLPRLVALRLPRDPDPDNAGNLDSLFTPKEVLMYPAGSAALSPNWSTVRASVTQGPDPKTAPALPGSLIRIIDAAEETVLSSGISDERGEALVIVPGVPRTTFAGGEEEGGGPPGGGPPGGGPPGGGPGPGPVEEDPPVLVHTLAVRLELSVQATTVWPVDPDLLEANHEANLRRSKELKLASGRMERVSINVT